jgi:hypothetical protein
MNKQLVILITLPFFIFTSVLPLAQGLSFDKLQHAEPIMKDFNRGHEENLLAGVPNSPQAISERFFNGFTAGDNFGYSVSSAGDVNGDGFDDIIVGAHQNDAGGNNAGRAYIYFGGRAFNSIPDVILTGAAALDFFGTSVAAAGDVNGDGFADVIVGAPGNDARGTNAGRAYIYFGGVNMNNTADVILTGAGVGDNFGNSVSTAGDVDGDGYSDVIVGAYLNDNGGADAGRAYIFYGGVNMNSVADVTMTGLAANDQFGYSVSTAGDVNGDGYSDVVVGAPRSEDKATDAGKAFIYYGGSKMNNTPDVILSGVAPFDFFGFSVSDAGDVNGDGYGDVIVGAPYNDAGANDAGSAYIFYGGINMNDTYDVTFNGEAINDNLGYSVSSAGDMNGDGFSDVIVGIPFNDAEVLDGGKTLTYFGSPNMDNIAEFISVVFHPGDNFGFSVSSAGDFNGDGFSDLLVGAWQNDENGTNAGRAYVYSNSLFGNDLPDLILIGTTDREGFGVSVSSAGDVNGDGYEDIIVGAYQNDNQNGTWAGNASIYFGGELLDNIPDVILQGEAPFNYFGISVSKAGDVNGDGYDDVIVGASNNDAGGQDAGRAYLYYGGANMDNLPDLVFTHQEALSLFGFSVSDAGDVNGDGYDDIIIGAYEFDDASEGSGRAYIYLGGASMNNTADIVLSDTTAKKFGYSVSTAGDVNGDGYDDVIIGSFSGIAYLYLGGTTMDIIRDARFFGDYDRDEFSYEPSRFGRAVSTAGDVNGDGYDDIIIGATGSKSSYIYFGEASLNNRRDATISSEGFGFGASVSSAGDVNADGYSDVIIGDPSAFRGVGLGGGGSYIYLGGWNVDTTMNIPLIGLTIDTDFGASVASGDFNGDGYSDVIVGSPIIGVPGLTGYAYVYLSTTPPSIPRIISVKDVPNDQGGKVLISFTRSAFDAFGINKISGYAVEMSKPPVNGRFDWIQLGTVTPLQYPNYTYLASTLSDSSGSSSGTHYFRITARGIGNDNTYRSNIAFGSSIDNIAPLAPSGFNLLAAQQIINLSWKPNTERDLKEYQVYKADTNPSTDLTFLGATTDTSFVDSTQIAAYYFVCAVDVHDNKSPFTVDSLTLVSVEDEFIVTEFELFQNYPNPFNPSTKISWQSPVSSHQTLKVYDVLGNEVATLVNEYRPAGTYETEFSAEGLTSGIYFYKLQAITFVETKKMILMK